MLLRFMGRIAASRRASLDVSPIRGSECESMNRKQNGGEEIWFEPRGAHGGKTVAEFHVFSSRRGHWIVDRNRDEILDESV